MLKSPILCKKNFPQRLSFAFSEGPNFQHFSRNSHLGHTITFFYNFKVWGMLGPEVICAALHTVTMLLNLRTVFRVKTDLEDFSTLRTVFFVNACLLPLVTGFHVTALIMINDRGAHAMYTYAGVSVLLSIYLLCGFIICDKTMMRALAQCTGQSKKPSSMDPVGTGTIRGTGTNVAMSTHHISR